MLPIFGGILRELAMPPNFFGGHIFGYLLWPWIRGHSFVNGYAPEFATVINFIHHMAIHNTTKLLPLTNQTELTLTVTLSLTDTVTIIFFMHILLTPIKRLYCINKRNFSPRCVAGFRDLDLDLSINWQTSHWEYHTNEKEVMLLAVFRL